MNSKSSFPKEAKEINKKKSNIVLKPVNPYSKSSSLRSPPKSIPSTTKHNWSSKKG